MTHLRINPIRVIALFLALAPLPLMGRSFLSPIKSSVILGTDSIVIADVNHDGKPDLVLADRMEVGIMLGNGDGTFQHETVYDSGGNWAAVAVGDLNGDGKLDIAVANSDPSSDLLGVLLGNGDGTFQPVQIYHSGSPSPQWIALADVNGDGKLDVIVNNSTCADSCTNSVVSVLLGNGNGTLRAAKTFNSGMALGFVVADVNGDGKADLVAVENNAIGVMLGKGDGTFGAIAYYTSGNNNISSIAAADVNGDHKTDILVTFGCTQFVQCLPGQAAVYLGNGDGTFQPFVAYATGAKNALSIAAADVNHDGKVDLVVSNGCALKSRNCTGLGFVSILFGKGDGTFKPPQVLGTGGTNPLSVIIGDVNEDKKPDIVVLNSLDSYYHPTSGIVAVMLNNIP